MRAFVTTTTAAAAVLLLATGSASYAQQPRAEAPCARQIIPNPSFERGTTGWTAGPRIVVLADEARPAHTGRAYATFGGLDVTRTDVLRTTATVPAGCSLTLSVWARATTTETLRSDYLNVGLLVTGTPPKTVFPLSSDHGPEWRQHTTTWPSATTERSATVSLYASESAGGGTTAFDVDDVTITLS
ncbi:MAG: hypothetical protein ABW022_00150 [Actinoplanes sp.]